MASKSGSGTKATPKKKATAPKTPKKKAAPKKKPDSPQAKAAAASKGNLSLPRKRPVFLTKEQRLDDSLDDLLEAFMETAIDNDDCDYSEIINRAGTIFRMMCDLLDIDTEEAKEIAWSYGQSYAAMKGELDDFQCDDCKEAERLSLASSSDNKKNDKLLN